MILFKRAEPLAQYILQKKGKGLSIGFVPTMGALHQGHLSLIKDSCQQNDITVCSIFVNPTQFNNADDFKLYPVTIEKDIEQLIASGCDLLFLPSKEEIYPPGYQPKHYSLGHLETILEGRYRPGHFQGVCQVVDRLLTIVQPTNLYLGQKDYQQCMVVAKLLELTNRNNDVHLIVAPTIREKDGLAMSSRNLRLSSAQHSLAPALFESLQAVKHSLSNKPFFQLKDRERRSLEQKGFKVDYFEIADARTLQPAHDTSVPIVALVAASIGDIRLIDNLQLN